MKQVFFFMTMVAMLSIVSCRPSDEVVITTQEAANIEFVEGKTIEQVLEQAQLEGKPIFIDFYTTWCAPCKWLEQDVFSLPNIAGYYNENFINFKVNAEDFDYVALAQEYEVGAYPTLLFLTQDGEFIRKEEGTTSASKFIEWGKDAVIQNEDVK